MDEKFRGLNEIYRHRSKYQLIQVFQDKARSGRILVLDGKTQLTTWDQHRYHESLAAVPYLFTRFAKRVLILGGGDGYAAKVLLDHFPVEEITLVDIDAEVIEASKAFFDFPSEEKIQFVYQDAFEYVQKAYGVVDPYDMVVCDYTDPTSAWSAPLYTYEHFRDIGRLMSPGGVFSIQIASPFINPKAFACAAITVKRAFPDYNVQPYAVHMPMSPIPSQNGFCLAAPGDMLLQIQPGFWYLNPASINALFIRGNDELYNPEGVELSTLKNELYAQLFQMIYKRDLEDTEETLDV